MATRAIGMLVMLTMAATGFSACMGESASQLETEAYVDTLFTLDLLTYKSTNGGECQDLDTAIPRGCSVSLLTYPEGAVIDGGYLFWVPEAEQVGSHFVTIAYSEQCPVDAAGGAETIEIDVQKTDAPFDNHGESDVHDLEKSVNRQSGQPCP